MESRETKAKSKKHRNQVLHSPCTHFVIPFFAIQKNRTMKL